MSISITSLLHINTKSKLFAAMRKTAKLKHCVAHLYNKKKQCFLACRYLTGAIAWRILGVSSGFMWLDKNNKDVTKQVNASLLRTI